MKPVLAPISAAPAMALDDREHSQVARPTIALERLSRDGDALVVYELKHPISRRHHPRVLYRDVRLDLADTIPYIERRE
jgi:hypothetical protein